MLRRSVALDKTWSICILVLLATTTAAATATLDELEQSVEAEPGSPATSQQAALGTKSQESSVASVVPQHILVHHAAKYAAEEQLNDNTAPKPLAVDGETITQELSPPAELAPVLVPVPVPVLITTTTTTPAAPAAPKTPEYLKHCFYAEVELCTELTSPSGSTSTSNQANAGTSSTSTTNPDADTDAAQDVATINGGGGYVSQPQRDINSCQCAAHPTVANSWYCCNITHISMISSCNNVRNWTNLHIRNLTMPGLDLSNSIYRSLHSLAITDGNITNVYNQIPRHSGIKCLNLTNNNITDISPRAVKDAPLEFLGIAKNNLSRVPNWNLNNNITMDISNNMHILCEPLSDAIYSDSFQFVNPDQSFCLYNATHKWFNSTDLVSIKQLERTKQCLTKCPIIPNYGKCICTHEPIMIIQGESKPICHVDCSNMGLVQLPPRLPDNTFSLNITNNKITSLGDHFHTNPTYHNIVKLIADNNQISSIYEFEGTKFIEHFQRIYMRNNSLSKIPEYFLNNALMDTGIGRRIYLAGNRLQCDCNSAKTLQNWLKERSSDIPDYMEIRCRNLPQSVLELQETKLCQAPPDWTDYIYYLIAAEVILLLALIAKVSYDYWVFKTAGYLPWPASKMPKLPCDWLCES